MMSRERQSKVWLRAAVVAVMSSASSAHAVDLSQTVSLNIDAQPLVGALIEFSEQARIQVMSSGADVDQRQAPRITGEYSIGDALRKMLAESGLSYVSTGPNTIIVAKPTTAEPGAQTVRGAALSRVALVDSTSERERTEAQAWTSPAIPAANNSIREERGARIELEEVLVTGSHIRGSENFSSPVITFDREDIEASGYTTTQQVMQSLPQNFNNLTDTQGMAPGSASSSVSYLGAGVNLRGLGTESTLVLLNGRRLAASGNGSFVDISLIPISAVERIEVLTDGASAIYGSDAVGGVVNMTLRKDFEGAETSLRYGTVTDGDHHEMQASQLLGHAWSSGQALVSYEYFKRNELTGSERSFVSSEYRSATLVPEQTRQGALAVLSQRLGDRMQLQGEGFYGARQSAYRYNTGFQVDNDMDVKQYGGSLGLSVDLGRDWQLRVSGLYDQNESHFDGLIRLGAGIPFLFVNESQLRSIDAAADGVLGELPGGEVRLAVGAQARDEQFMEGGLSPVKLDRDIVAGYAELNIPWVGAGNRRAGIERLELTLAGRYESYSDFGKTFNPKIGLSWGPTRALNVRGSWGTSFKAPLLEQTNPLGFTASVYDRAGFIDELGATTALWVEGSGVNLQPEESTNWTAGFDIEPLALNGLKLSASYFNIDYDDRIRVPYTQGTPFGILLDPHYATVVTRNPDPAEVSRLLSLSRFPSCYYTIDYLPCDPMLPPEQVRVIVDTRLKNIAGVRMSGLDFSAMYRWRAAMGDWGVHLSGQHLLENRERLVPGVPQTSELNNVHRPVDTRLRGGVSYSTTALNVSAFVNFTDGYRDRRTLAQAGPLQRPEVASWTTVDLSVRYDLKGLFNVRQLDEMALSLTASNLFDRSPPFVGSGTTGFYFDSANANAIGRFIGARLTARW